jgi:hypothetical protein
MRIAGRRRLGGLILAPLGLLGGHRSTDPGPQDPDQE